MSTAYFFSHARISIYQPFITTFLKLFSNILNIWRSQKLMILFSQLEVVLLSISNLNKMRLWNTNSPRNRDILGKNIDFVLWPWLWQFTLTLVPEKRSYNKKFTFEIWKSITYHLKLWPTLKFFFFFFGQTEKKTDSAKTICLDLSIGSKNVWRNILGVF